MSDTCTTTSVGDSITSVTLLASNTGRDGATIYNHSTANLYIRCGDPASATTFTVMLADGDYWEVPAAYTGIITGIWATDAGGYARVNEFTTA